MIMYFEWFLYVLFVGLVISGFLGFLIILMLVFMLYIVDIIEKMGLVFRLGKVVDMYYRIFFMEVKVFFFC